jgi:putative zinc finger/helix-turn-helix YgiT family protein
MQEDAMKSRDSTQESPTRKCYECGKTMHGAYGNYRYTECGLDSVNLVGILIFHCKCGAIVPQIHAMGDLHRKIMLSLITKETLLSGSEIRFLRKMAGLKGTEMSQLLGIHKTNLSKWENGKLPINKRTDATLRLLCFTAVLQQLVKENGESKQLVPQLANALKKLSEVDLAEILRKVRDVATGPKRVVIDPQQLANFGTLDQEASTPLLQ